MTAGEDGLPPDAEPAGPEVVVLPAVRLSALARVCALVHTGGHLVPQPGCVLLVLGPDAWTDAVPQLSRALRRAQLMKISLVDGYLSAEVWQRGALISTPPAGVVAQQLPDVTVRLVHGSLDPLELAGCQPVPNKSHLGLLDRLRGRSSGPQ